MKKVLTTTAVALALVSAGAITARAETTETTVTRTNSGMPTETTVTRTTSQPMGRMVVTSETTRSFHIGDDTTHVYVAPESVDLSTLRDKEVRVYVDGDGHVTRVTRVEHGVD